MTQHVPFQTTPDFAASCNDSRLDALRLGVLDSNLLGCTQKPVWDDFSRSVNILKDLGADIVDEIRFSKGEVHDKRNGQNQTIPSDFVETMSNYFSNLVENQKTIHNLDDLITFTKNHPDEGYPDRNVKLWEVVVSMPDEKPVKLTGGILYALKKLQLAALIVPGIFDTSSNEVAVQGLPAIAVPMTFLPEGSKLESTKRGDLLRSGPRKP